MGLRAHVVAHLGDFTLDATLQVAGGEVVALLGPNGAGKSTLLAVLAGLRPADAGRITLDRRVLDDPDRGVRVAPRSRGAGVVFQDHLLFPHLTAAENVAFGLRAGGLGARAARWAADGWLDRVGLTAVGGVRPTRLSGGQAQRVALARALACEPGLLLLDEPLSALDVQTRLAVRRELHDHLGAFRGPCVLVTHDPVEAFALADRLVILEEGRVVQDGSIDEVTQRPRSSWSAGLVGLNLYRGRGEGHAVALPGGHELVTASPVGGDVFAAVHPRAVALYRTRPEGTPRNVWTGQVAGLDVQGDRVRVQVDGAVPIVAEVTPAAVTALELGLGGEVTVSVKATEVVAYPA